jgi:hypothetical protein
MRSFLLRSWARFRRLWFHPWAHWLGYVKPRFNRTHDFYNYEWGYGPKAVTHRLVLMCECGKVFYKGD